jgi:hypothetical protein
MGRVASISGRDMTVGLEGRSAVAVDRLPMG